MPYVLNEGTFLSLIHQLISQCLDIVIKQILQVHVIISSIPFNQCSKKDTSTTALYHTSNKSADHTKPIHGNSTDKNKEKTHEYTQFTQLLEVPINAYVFFKHKIVMKMSSGLMKKRQMIWVKPVILQASLVAI